MLSIIKAWLENYELLPPLCWDLANNVKQESPPA